MESHFSPAEDLPALYRAVLDGVDLLERRGQRLMAADIRRRATRAYSTAWNERQRDRLMGLRDQAMRALAPEVRARGSRLRPGWRRQAAPTDGSTRA
jgi:hypothetical protein